MIRETQREDSVSCANPGGGRRGSASASATERDASAVAAAPRLRLQDRLAANLSRALSRLGGGRFGRSVAILAGGTILGQGLTIAAAPLLTRLYAPPDFGIAGVFASILAIVVVNASLRYQLAIPLPESDCDAAAVTAVSIAILPVVATAAGGLLWLSHAELLQRLGAEALRPYIWIVPIGVLLSGAYGIFSYWAVRKRAFPRIARTKINQGISVVVLQLLLFPLGPLGLLLGIVAGSAVGTITLILLAWKSDRASFRNLSWRATRNAARRYWRFPAFSAPAGLANVAGLHLPVLLLAGTFGPVVVGQFVLVQRIAGGPLNLLGQSVAKVYVGEGARVARDGSDALRSLYLHTSVRLGALAVLPAFILLLFGQWLFSFLFGSEWQSAGRYAQIMALMLAAQFIASPLSQTLNIVGRQSWSLAWDLCRLALVLLAFGAVWLFHLSAFYAVVLYSVAMTAGYALLWSLCLVALRRGPHESYQ